MNQNNTYVGLDAHSKHINVAVMLPGSKSINEQWQFNHDQKSLRKFARKVLKMGGGEVHAAYEAGSCGYALKRSLDGLGIHCDVVAPSLIPVKPGEHIKTDPRDARKLATLHRAELLTVVHPPNEEEEALRDLVRARQDAQKDFLAARQRLNHMMLRHGRHFTETTKKWTKKHWAWLKRQRFDQKHLQSTLDMYLLATQQAQERLNTLDALIGEAAQEEAYAQRAGWLRCLRGVDTVTAMIILAELHGFQRFTDPRQLMSYLGLTPSEHSSGGKTKRGAITKAGNKHVRRALIEAAWHYRHRPAVSAVLRRRRAGQPAAVIAIADKAQHRLHRRHRRLKEDYNKNGNVVTTAVARELVGFIWAILNHQELGESAQAA